MAYGVRRKYFSDGELDSVMNYPLRSAIIDFVLTGRCELLVKTVQEQINNYPKEALDCLMNILSTHDSTRIITLLGRRETVTDKNLMASEKLDSFEYNRAVERQKLASVLQFFLYGVPSVYYGDEIGLEGDLDPYNRRCFTWDNMDKNLLEHYKKIASIRNKNVAFKMGEIQIKNAKGGTFVFTRGEDNEKITVALNATNHVKEIVLSGNMCDLYTGQIANKFTIKSNGFVILKPTK